MRFYDKYKQKDYNDFTPLFIPLITVDFYQETGIIISFDKYKKPFKKYLGTAEFYSQEEYDKCINDLNTQLLSNQNNKK